MTAHAPKTATPAIRLPLALWLATPILLANLAISIAAFASTAAIPLDILLAGGGEVLIALVLFLGLSDLLLASLFVVALLRVGNGLMTRRARRSPPQGRWLQGPLGAA